MSVYIFLMLALSAVASTAILAAQIFAMNC
jgi:hypothetical protein